MIHYHGGPITPETCAIRAWKGRHAFISFAHPHQLELAADICQSFAFDNGAFTIWEAAGRDTGSIRWDEYYEFVERWKTHPGFDFAVIPDVIDGGDDENDALLKQWPHGKLCGVPVWHMNESDDRFVRLCHEYPRVAIGSCGEYDVRRPAQAVARLKELIKLVVDKYNRPVCKLHGLRMLNPKIFSRLPLASADSTNVARNIGIDKKWKGTYQPTSKETRASVMVERIEALNSASCLEYDDKVDKLNIQYQLMV